MNWYKQHSLLDFEFCRANLLGTQFTLFDNGDNPKTNYENARKELVGIIYVSDLWLDDDRNFNDLKTKRFFIGSSIPQFVHKTA